MDKKLLLFLLMTLAFVKLTFAQGISIPAYSVMMRGTDVEDESTARNITCDTVTIPVEVKLGKVVRTEYKTQYTFHGLLEDGYDVSFYCHNDGNINNITFTNATESSESPFTVYLPGKDKYLVAVYGHYDYTSNLTTFNTAYAQGKNEGYIVVLDGSRNKIKSVVKFGFGNYSKEVIEEVANIAEFKSKARSSKLDLGNNDVAKVYTITGPLTFINYSLGQSWAYVQDETGSLAIYINHSYPLGSANYTRGDIVRRATGYSVGDPDGGAYMDLEAERFYVKTANHENEFTKFPVRTDETGTLTPPRIITDLSTITPKDEYTYVQLGGCSYDKAVNQSEDSTNVHPSRIVDAKGNKIFLSLDLFFYYDDTTKADGNSFEENVPNGYAGNFIGFLNNLNKNLFLFEWNQDEIPSSISTVSDTQSEGKGKIYRVKDEFIIRRGNKSYSISGACR